MMRAMSSRFCTMSSNQRRRMRARSFASIFAQGAKARWAASIARIVSASPKRGILASTAPLAGLAIGRVPSPTHFPSTRHLSLRSEASASFMGRASKVGELITNEGVGRQSKSMAGRRLREKIDDPGARVSKSSTLIRLSPAGAVAERLDAPRAGGKTHDNRPLVSRVDRNADRGALDPVHRLPGDDERGPDGGELRGPQAASGPFLGPARSPRLSQRDRMFRSVRRAGYCRPSRRKSERDDGLLGDELFLAEARARHSLLGGYPLSENGSLHPRLHLRRRDFLGGDQIGFANASRGRTLGPQRRQSSM